MEDVIATLPSRLGFQSQFLPKTISKQQLTNFWRLAQFWTDSQKLAQAGAYAYLDAAVGNPVALATLMGYFGISSTTDGTFKATQSKFPSCTYGTTETC